MAVLIHNIHKNWMAAVSMSLCSLSDCLSLITKVISGSSVALHNNSSNFYHQVFPSPSWHQKLQLNLIKPLENSWYQFNFIDG